MTTEQPGDDAVIQLDAFRLTTRAERFVIKRLFGDPVDLSDPHREQWSEGSLERCRAAVAEADAALGTTTARLADLQRRHLDWLVAKFGPAAVGVLRIQTAREFTQATAHLDGEATSPTPPARRKVPGRAKLNGTTTRKENRNAK